jgi:hypothetical protein
MPVPQPKLVRRDAPPEQPVALPPIPSERLLTTRQVAAILNMKIDTLKKWRARGKGPAFLNLDSGAIRYRLEAVQKYLSDCGLRR